MSAKLRRHTLTLLILGALLLGGCLEDLSTTRIPAGAARNFFHYLAYNQQADANAYWAPGYVPPDAVDQVRAAAMALHAYNVEALKAESQHETDGAMTITLRGHATPKPETAGGAEIPLLRARLIEIGPGWRITEFTLLCCGEP